MDEDKIDNNTENIKDNKSNEHDKITENITTNDEGSTSSLLQPAGNEKLASEYEQFMKMVCTTTDVTEEYSPKKNPVKSTSPHSYHEFDIESNLAEDSINMEIALKEKFERRDKQTLEGSIKSTECEESTLSTDCQIQVDENNIQIECTNENDESENSKSIPSDWENVRIKVERLSDENTESREVKKKKKQKKISSSDSSSIISSDSEKGKKKKKRKRKILSNSSSSDSDNTDSSSSSSDSSSSEERRKRKRKKKKIEKKRKKAKRTARIKKKRRRKMSTDSNSSDSDKCTKKRKKVRKKVIEAKSINNGDISNIISKSPVIASDGTKILRSVTPVEKIKEEAAGEDRKRCDQVTSTKRTTADISVHDNECLKQKKERKENKPDESFMEQWEVDSMMQQNDGDISSQDHEELEKVDDLEKGKYRRKRKHSRDNIEHDKDRLSKVNEEKIHEGKARSDEEVETKRKKKREKDIKCNAEFLANWEKEGERITQQIIQNEAKYLKKLEKQKKEKWGETDFDTLNVPSLTQLEKEVCQKQLLADEWEVDSLEAISDLIMSKRKSNQGSLKKVEKEVRYDKKTDTYIAIEKESVKEMKKKQQRLCAIRIWEEEQEEGEREEMMRLEQKSKQHKTDDWDIEEESLFRKKNTEEMEVCKVNNIVAIEKKWTKTDEEKNIKEDANKLTKPSKRVKKSRWDMGSQSEEKPEVKDIWEEEYAEWSKINKCEQEFEKIKKELCTTDYSESSSKSDLIEIYQIRKSQSRESLERSWTSEEVALRPVQSKKDPSVKHLISAKTNKEQLASIKERQTRNQFQEILESDVKFKEKTLELYSPSSPALSQKSQVSILSYRKTILCEQKMYIIKSEIISIENVFDKIFVNNLNTISFLNILFF